jgi:hypothetical protein
MAGESVWIVTWLPLPTSVVGHKRKALSPEHREFDDLTNAVSFVMGLDETPSRRRCHWACNHQEGLRRSGIGP